MRDVWIATNASINSLASFHIHMLQDFRTHIRCNKFCERLRERIHNSSVQHVL